MKHTAFCCVQQLRFAPGGRAICLHFLGYGVAFDVGTEKSSDQFRNWTLGWGPPSQDVLTTWALWAHLSFVSQIEAP